MSSHSIMPSASDLEKLSDMNRRRLEAEELWLATARGESPRWQQEEARRWKAAVALGDEWLAFKRKLGLLPNTSPEPQSDDCNVICPHCRSSYLADPKDFCESQRERECFTCGKKYILYSEFSAIHHTLAA